MTQQNIKIPLVLGAHMSIAGGLENALLAGQKRRCQCIQMFVANQRQWQHPPLTDQQIKTFRQTRDKTSLSPVAAHASYLINLAAADKTVYRKSITALSDEYDRCRRLQLEYLIIHPGAHMGQGPPKGIKKIVGALNHILNKYDRSHCKIILETTAGQGTCLGHTFAQIAKIISTSAHPRRLGVCLDTCHIFAAGYDFRTESAYRNTMREFDQTIGLSKLEVIHINDTRTDLGSHVDRHEHIGKGFIGRDGFRHFLTDHRLRHIPFILETPKGLSPGGRDLDMLNLAALRRLIQ